MLFLLTVSVCRHRLVERSFALSCCFLGVPSPFPKGSPRSVMAGRVLVSRNNFHVSAVLSRRSMIRIVCSPGRSSKSYQNRSKLKVPLCVVVRCLPVSDNNIWQRGAVGCISVWAMFRGDWRGSSTCKNGCMNKLPLLASQFLVTNT
jgi:hypothetical protein